MMKKILLTAAIAMAFSTAYAHHPAADIVDPEIYAMIDENVSDTPHADLTFEDMGSASAPGGSADTDVSSAAEVDQAEPRGAMGSQR
ncbi:MAG: hypothetical protein PVG66_08845 [Chromatiales bacterium]